MKGSFLRAAAGAALALGAVTSVASAQIVGTFKLTGQLVATEAGVVDILLDFGNPAASDLVSAGLGTGAYAFLPGLPPGVNATLKNTVVGVGPEPIADWLMFPIPGATFSFDLGSILPGVFPPAQCFLPPAPGQTCTPPGTGFNLENHLSAGGISSSASFDATGTARNLITGQTGKFTATFSQPFNGLSYQQVAALVAQPGGFRTSFSADFNVTAVPEPATVALMVTGLLALGGVAIRRRNMA